MITITGKSVFGGVSIGKLSFYKRNQKVIKREHVENVESECVRFQEAKAEGIRQLKELYEKSIADVGEANAMIFEIHQMMLEDLDYIESIENIIRSQKVNAEFAVATTADNFAQMFAAMDDAYMQGRAADVKDVSERVLDILCGVSEGIKQTDEPSIIAADDLAPSETVQLDKSKVLAFATMYGSSNSHTAILARTMNIPAVIGLGESLSPQYDGKMAVIVGITNGDKIICSKYEGRSFKQYALIAGFAEIGETIEETVHREVMEEVGLKVKNLRYYKSQPWSFSGTLLFGFFCDVDGDDTLTVDHGELSVAQWFDRDKIIGQDTDSSLTNEMMMVFAAGKEPK